MSSLTTYCPTCGHALDSTIDQPCPHCAIPAPPAIWAEEKSWGVGISILTWLASVLLIFIFQAIVAAFYFFYKIRLAGTVPRTIEIDPLLVVISVAATFPAHLLTLLICYLVVTDRGRRPFLKTLGWDWHPQFKWVHAVGLAFLMFAVAVGLEQLLPHRETELERILKMGTSVRVLVASLAVLTAPLVEEVVYRGVLYTGIERNWGKASGIFLVTGLFALVHVPQYWGSYAAIMGILTLSLVLTWLRAATGKLLPCVATHLVYNGIQSFLVLWAPENLLENAPTKTAIALICRCLGVG